MSLSRRRTWASPNASAASVPGLIGSQRSAADAVRERRGSTWMILSLRSLPSVADSGNFRDPAGRPPPVQDRCSEAEQGRCVPEIKPGFVPRLRDHSCQRAEAALFRRAREVNTPSRAAQELAIDARHCSPRHLVEDGDVSSRACGHGLTCRPDDRVHGGVLRNRDGLKSRAAPVELHRLKQSGRMVGKVMSSQTDRAERAAADRMSGDA